MDKQQIRQNPKKWKGLVVALDGVRTPAHLISAISSMLFVVNYVLAISIVSHFAIQNPYPTYILISIPSLWLTLKFEWILQPLVNYLGFIFTQWSVSKAMVVILCVVTIPLILVTGSTSFVGTKATMEGDSKAKGIQEVIELKIKLGASANSSLDTKEISTIENQRANEREQIERKNVAALKKAKAENEKLEWSARQEANKAAEAKAEKELFDALKKFDSETSDKTQSVISKQKGEKSEMEKSNEKLIQDLAEAKASSAANASILGGFLGFVAVLSVLISVAASVGIHMILDALNCDLEDCYPTKKI